jgi:hypothetical protein
MAVLLAQRPTPSSRVAVETPAEKTVPSADTANTAPEPATTVLTQPPRPTVHEPEASPPPRRSPSRLASARPSDGPLPSATNSPAWQRRLLDDGVDVWPVSLGGGPADGHAPHTWAELRQEMFAENSPFPG